MIPQRMIDEVRQGTDIVDLVSDYARLQPSGRHFKALSPFTQEKTPSFIVSPDKQIYKCFSSGKGGNVFTFVMEMEKMSFPEAVEHLAKRAGIDISRYQEKPERRETAETDRRYETLRWAARLFHSTLESESGKAAYSYLTANRGLEAATIRRFGLGFAPESWDFLLRTAERQKIPDEQLTTLGLLTRNQRKNSLYDTMRNRVIFPILTIGGQVAGFGGRTLSADPETPKYINSPESALFEKSKLLYGLHAAKEEIRRQGTAVLVEGYMDVIALHQAGVTNAVASCGTALTRYQAGILRRYTQSVVFLYDGDNAGRKSMLAGIDILLAAGLTPSVVILPGNEDPDSFIRNNGKRAFGELMEKSRLPFLDFELLCYREAGLMETPDKASKSVSAMTRSISLVVDPVQKELYLGELSTKTGISRKTLEKVMPGEERARRAPVMHSAGAQNREPERPPKPAPLPVAERTFLEALIESTFYGKEVLAFASSHEGMLQLTNAAAGKIFSHLVRRFRDMAGREEETIDIAAEISSLEGDDARNLALEILFRLPAREQKLVLPEEIMRHARRCLSHFLNAVRTLVLEPLQHEKRELLNRLAATNEKAEEKQLLIQLHELNTRIRTTDQDFKSSISTILGE